MEKKGQNHCSGKQVKHMGTVVYIWWLLYDCICVYDII